MLNPAPNWSKWINKMLRRISHIHPSLRAIQRNNSQENLNFRHGEIIKGTVIQKYSGKEILVTAKGKQFHAYTTLDLLEGNKYRFEVKNEGYKIVLKVLDSLTHKLGSPLHLWSSNRITRNRIIGILRELSNAHNLAGLAKGTNQTLKNLDKLFPAIVFSDHGSNNSQWITSYLLGSGLFWENKILQYLSGEKNKSWKRLMVSDLKGLLLSLDKSLRVVSQDNDQLRSLAVKIREALFLIERDQFLNLSAMKEGLGWFWYIPGLAEDGFKNTELFVKKGKKEEGIYFSILLEFTFLGHVEIDASIIESIIGIKISVEDAEKASFVTKNLPILEKSIQDTGIATGKIVCDIKERQDLDINPFSERGEQSSVHIVI